MHPEAHEPKLREYIQQSRLKDIGLQKPQAGLKRKRPLCYCQPPLLVITSRLRWKSREITTESV